MDSAELVAELVRSARGSTGPAADRIAGFFRDGDASLAATRCAELLVAGRAAAEAVIEAALDRLDQPGATGHGAAAQALVEAVLADERTVTGAEAAAVLLAAAGVSDVFAYPGTSELALCDAVQQTSAIRLVNGRGDKECAFMAAGASLLRPNQGAAILHGARGLTNAAGAVADARRNEAGTMFVVGLPGTGSARYLPPHGEVGLLAGISTFVDWVWEAEAVPAEPAERLAAAREFVARFREGLAFCARAPHRPALFGVPQDVGEARWIPVRELLPESARKAADQGEDTASPADTAAAVQLLRAAERPVILIDDYALRYPGIQEALDQFSRVLGAPVLQLRYRRGPMLFERLHPADVPAFLGWLNQFSPAHRDLLADCDLLITVEDRNIYRRVSGPLPAVPKVVVNCDPGKAIKNGYVGATDAVVPGPPVATLARLTAALAEGAEATPASEPGATWAPEGVRATVRLGPEPAAEEVDAGRRALVRTLGELLADSTAPVLVDDSQMFGGLLAEYYDEFPRALRVFGGHGGFVGGGLATAVGLAIAHPDRRVVCTLGDQAFTNSFQGLIAAIEQRARVLFVVCNNGESVSLKKQAAASYGASRRAYLDNVHAFGYHRVAAELGLAASRVEVPIGGPAAETEVAVKQFAGLLRAAAEADGPSLVELVLPSDPAVWRGIWITEGFEQSGAAAG